MPYLWVLQLEKKLLCTRLLYVCYLLLLKQPKGRYEQCFLDTKAQKD